MEVRVRRVRAEELPGLLPLYMRAYQGLERYGESTEEEGIGYLRWLHYNSPEGFLVAEVSGRVVGFLACDPDWRARQRKVLEIHEVVVAPEFRGRGIGRALMEEAFRLGRARGREVASLWVGEGNVQARAWYRKLGFKEEGRWGEWIRMCRPLAGPR
ncbi:TPA: N-acetyltransferase [Candidatus Acetothermia bacterium]|nr:N-acetyltransferase [Candidatus Acetothermia bacterium]